MPMVTRPGPNVRRFPGRVLEAGRAALLNRVPDRVDEAPDGH